MGVYLHAACRILPAALVVLALGAWRAEAQGTTALFFQSQTGDWVGQGETKTYTEADGVFTISSTTNGVRGRVAGPSFSFWWDYDFRSPVGTPLLPGVYNTARRASFTPLNGLDFSGSGRGCNAITGRFVVLEAEYASGGTVLQFAADFEQHCEDGTPALFGAIRYKSSISSLTPFGGAYPSYGLTISAPSNGTVTSAGGLLCGTGGTVCAQTFGEASSVTLTATPDAGFIFAGWTEDCRGGAIAPINVNGPKQCGARFELAATPNPRTLVFFDSQSGDFIGNGKQQVYSDANSTITAQVSNRTLTFNIGSISADRYQNWTITMHPGGSGPLTTGTYEGTLGSSGGPWPRLDAGSCSNSGGRFIVQELELGSTGAVLRASVDLELHCPAATDAGFFAAIRFRSNDTTTVPFGGSYPTYRLSIAAPANGAISGGSLNCGSTGAACELNPAAPVTVTLTAVANSGYVFTGWLGGCVGSASQLTIRVNMIRTCTAAFEPLSTTSPRTRAFFDYMPESRGTGTPAVREAFSSQFGDWTVWLNSGRTIEFTVPVLSTSGSFVTSRRLSFSAPFGQVLTEGKTYWATRHPFTSASASMDATSSCNRLTGRFQVRELLVSNGTVTRAAIDFEEHCNDIDAAVFGTVRFNSALDAVPFGGEYPRYRFVLPVPARGRVSGAGLDCRAGAAPCELTFGAPTTISVTATPDPGYRFAGWTGLCHGGESITFRVNTIRECAPLFETVPASPPRAYLRMAGQPGDNILKGRTEVYSLGNSGWSAFLFGGSTPNELQFNVSGIVDADEADWNLSFRAPTGQALLPGTTYTNATSSFSSGPRISLSGGGFCSVTGSTFTIRELKAGTQASKVARAAIDFEIHCDTISSPALIGTIEYVELSDAARLSLDKSSLSFTTTRVGNSIGETTAPQTLRLSQSAGSSNVSWSITTNVPWLQVSPTFGTGPALLTVSVQATGLIALGNHVGTITVSAGGESLPPVTVAWSVLPDSGSPPFGRFDTPIAFTPDLTGAVALTGWALDDVEVTGVQIWRQAHPSDPSIVIYPGPGPQTGKVFIGNATLVEGARPDVEASFPLAPFRSRGGWGYMLLTRGFVWDGQGMFTMHAIATDRDGHVTEIGSTAFSVNNALATKPFGTIDTPGQGMTVSGIYANQGWVLTPKKDGTTIPAANVHVVIDGMILPGVPSTSGRPDVSSLFQGLDTSQAGRGILIDTRSMADGLHTIAWLVTDSSGEADGIGSRFFQVANGGTGSLQAAARAQSLAAPGVDPSAVDAAPAGMGAIRVRTGFDPATPFETRYGSSEAFSVTAEELDRIEVRLPETPGTRYSAYLRAVGDLRPLPAGSSLDPSGTFTWQPGAGFVGAYDVVFIGRGRDGSETRYELRVTLTPRQK